MSEQRECWKKKRAETGLCLDCKNKALKSQKRCQECLDRDVKRQRWAQIKRLYGITMEQYDAMVLAQENKCAICGLDFRTQSKQGRIDHCHETGVIRGILCNGCNTGLGHIEKSNGWLEKAMSYIGKYEVSA